MNPLFQRIMAGESVPEAEVKRFNAESIRRRVAEFDRSPCTNAGGKRACVKNCTCGKTRQSDLDFADLLEREATVLEENA